MKVQETQIESFRGQKYFQILPVNHLITVFAHKHNVPTVLKVFIPAVCQNFRSSNS